MCKSCKTPEAVFRHRELSKAYMVKKRAKHKALVIAAYGGKCSCCPESHPAFLCIDHINNDGAKHREEIGRGRTTNGRRKVGSGSIIMEWLVKNNFPKGFQLLCANCNTAKQSLGYCPHTVDMV